MALKHGQGTNIFANGDSYIGEFKEGKPDGKGTFTSNDGSVYIGEYVQGLKQGKGKWRSGSDYASSNHYEGDFYDGLK